MPDLAPIPDLVAYGLFGVALLALLERLVPVVPSYGLFLMLGSSMAATPADLAALIAAATLGSTLGGLCWYGIGYVLGEARTHQFVRRFGRYVWLTEELYLSLASRYSRNAFIATFIGQTVPVVRVYLSLPAGILALPLATFTLAVLAGTLIWVGGFTTLGYGLHVLGWDPIVATIGGVLALLVVECGIVWLLRRRRGAAAAASD